MLIRGNRCRRVADVLGLNEVTFLRLPSNCVAFENVGGPDKDVTQLTICCFVYFELQL